MVPINAPRIDEREIEMVVKVLKSGILTARVGSSSMVASFEQSYAKLVEAKHAVAVNSGTAALHMALLAVGVKPGDEVIVPSFTFVATAEVVVALLAVGVKPGDEVIVPSFTFVATAEVVVLCGAQPVFVDICPQTYNIDPEKFREAINTKTRAVIPVDLYGLSGDMQAISKIAKEHNLAVIEDAAQAHGASYRGKSPGYFADMACWSFYASKNMTTGEGGMITTNNDEYADGCQK